VAVIGSSVSAVPTIHEKVFIWALLSVSVPVTLRGRSVLAPAMRRAQRRGRVY